MANKTAGNDACEYLDRHFRKACSVILGEEVGALSDYEEWLLSLKQPMGHAKSSVSGKGLALASPDYSPSACFIALGEENAAAKPFSINHIKDIDSLMEAARERFAYSGNLVFGNSKFVEGSSDVSDSFYIYKSARVSGCKAIACSTIIKESNYLFGCNVASKDEYCMRCHQFTFNTRCFEVNITTSSSDCYYTYDCLGCKEAMFSFGQRNGLYMVGNLVLPKEKYLQLKSSLLEQIRGELVAKKRAPSFQDIFQQAAAQPVSLAPEAKACAKKFERKANRAPVQKAWDDTCRIVLGKGIGEIARYKEWLLRHNIRVRKVKSVLGSGEIPAPSYENLKALPDNRYVNIDERLPLMRLMKLSEGEAERIALANTGKTLGRIAYITPQFHEGQNLNAYECPIVLWSTDCEGVHGCVYMKKSAYSTWARDSDHMFGSAFVFDSAFCINCYNSFKLQNCFEVDSARSCTGCYFCHNVENCHDAIFCSNAKNLKYAVCNKEVGREEFIRVKAMLLARVNAELGESGSCAMDVYRIGKN